MRTTVDERGVTDHGQRYTKRDCDLRTRRRVRSRKNVNFDLMRIGAVLALEKQPVTEH